MSNCEKICLFEGCNENVECYANYSRYHGVCNIHQELTNQNQSITCIYCHGNIRIIAELENRKKEDYDRNLELAEEIKIDLPSTELLKKEFMGITLQEKKNPIKPKLNFQSVPVAIGDKANEEKKIIITERKIAASSTHCCMCKGKFELETFCGDHNYCKPHKVIDNCRKCKCKNCGKVGVEIFKCQHRLCKDCKPCKECCEFCYKNKKIDCNECLHKVCSECFSFNNMCPHIKCINCNTNRPSQRECNHLICISCDTISNGCPKCLEGICSCCKELKLVVQSKCEHKQCNECLLKNEKCQECQKQSGPVVMDDKANEEKKAIIMERKIAVSSTHCCMCKGISELETFCGDHNYCKSHKVIDKCRKCKCKNCGKVGVEIFKCQHRLCKDCKPCKECCEFCYKNKKIDCNECLHKVCSECFSFNNMCPHIKCINCNTNRPSQRECNHLICLSCDTMSNGCPKCLEGICSCCKELKLVVQSKCEHKQCNECLLKNEKCQECQKLYICLNCKSEFFAIELKCQSHPQCENCNNIFKDQECVFCAQLENTPKCDLCGNPNIILSRLECKHKACDKCIVEIGNYVCTICNVFKCASCQMVLELNYRGCYHSVCNNCKERVGCPECNQLNNEECQYCFRYGAVNNCVKDHKLCGICSQLYPNKCVVCEPFCSYCRKTKPKIMRADCRHSFCEDCKEEFIGDSYTCIICSREHEQFLCFNCNKITKKLENCSCNKNFCNECIQNGKCNECSKKACDFCMKLSKPAVVNCNHIICENCFEEQ